MDRRIGNEKKRQRDNSEKIEKNEKDLPLESSRKFHHFYLQNSSDLQYLPTKMTSEGKVEERNESSDR